MKIKKYIFLFPLLFFFAACGTKKAVTSTAGAKASVANIIKNHEKAEPDFKSLQGNLRASYEDAAQAQSISVSIRMKKDKAIWMSAKLAGLIPLAKIKITPDRVQYYEKINQTYFDGDFSLLSKWLGTDLDFQKVQNLLIGQAIYKLRDGSYQLQTTPETFRLTSPPSEFIKKAFMLNPENYRIMGEQLVRDQNNQSVTITYPEYQEVQGYIFPKKISIIANQEDKNTQIEINYRSLEFDVPVTFPFDIPDGYQEMKIK